MCNILLKLKLIYDFFYYYKKNKFYSNHKTKNNFRVSLNVVVTKQKGKIKYKLNFYKEKKSKE